MTNAQKQRMVAERVGGFLADHLEKSGPVTAAFQPYGLRFDVYGTENEGLMQLRFHAPGMLGLQLGIYRQGTDRLHSHFMPVRSKEEMIRYLRDPASHRQWLEEIAQLSDRVDEYWD